jgi:hypothetical protein
MQAKLVDEAYSAPASFTTTLKLSQMKALGYTVPNELSGQRSVGDVTKCIERSKNPSCYEEDHLINLELGWSPNSPQNLWPEPLVGPWNARVKDRLENKLHKMVCDGKMSLTDAQKAIATDWVAAYRKYVGEP